MKRKNVSVKVSSDFYRMMEMARLKLKNKYKVNIKSHTQLTEYWSKNNDFFFNKKLMESIKKCSL